MGYFFTIFPTIIEKTYILVMRYLSMQKELLSLITGALLISLCGCSNSSILPKGDGKLPTFAVSLKNDKDVHLALSTKSDFSSKAEKYEIPDTLLFELDTYSNIFKKNDLDSELTDYTYGSSQQSGQIVYRSLKFTFFIKNEGPTIADFQLNVKLSENKKSSNGRGLDSILRMGYYLNDVSTDDHYYYVYAKEANNGGQEAISISEQEASIRGEDFPGYAERFEGESSLLTHMRTNMLKDDAVRCTLVFWLEGYDEQATNTAPEGASLKFAVTINGSETY